MENGQVEFRLLSGRETITELGRARVENGQVEFRFLSGRETVTHCTTLTATTLPS